MIIFASMFIAGSVVASEYYYFAFDKTDRSKSKSSFVRSSQVQNLTHQYVDRSGTNMTIIIMEVTQAQYQAGFAALTAQEKADAVSLAETDESDFEKWTDKDKAMMKATKKMINDVRTSANVGLPALTMAEVKAIIKQAIEH